MRCKYCNNKCVKKGKINGKQRYQCKECKRTQQLSYIYNKKVKDEKFLTMLNNEGVGISSISRLMNIPKTTVQRLIQKISKELKPCEIEESDQLYEIDEIKTFVGNKKNESWVIYGINKLTGKAISFCIGRRNKENIKKVVDAILNLNPQKIFTDGLNVYPGLIPKKIHRVFVYNTNKIERFNLNFRTHLKRLCRKTICFSRSEEMLYNCVNLYMTKNNNLVFGE